MPGVISAGGKKEGLSFGLASYIDGMRGGKRRAGGRAGRLGTVLQNSSDWMDTLTTEAPLNQPMSE